MKLRRRYTLTNKLKHVHIGCGRLGLGLIGDVIQDVHSFAPSVFVNRECPTGGGGSPGKKGPERHQVLRRLKGHKKYLISIPQVGKKAKRKPVRFDSVCFFPRSCQTQDFYGKCHEGLVAVADPQTRLITTAVGEKGMKDIPFFLVGGLKRRMQANGLHPPTLYVLACENVENNSKNLQEDLLHQTGDRHLRRFVENSVVFCNTVVDRICSRIDICESTDMVVVHAEQHREWIVEKEKGLKTKALEDIFYGSDVRFVNHIDPFEKRKFWLVNGVLLALGTLAVNEFWADKNRQDLEVLRHALDDEKIGPKLELYQTDVAQALYEVFKKKRVFKLRELYDFNNCLRERLRHSDDTVWRILRELLELTNLDQVILETVRRIYTDISEKHIDFGSKPEKVAFIGSLELIAAHLTRMLQDLELSTFFRKINERLSAPIYALLPLIYERKSRRKRRRVGNQALLIVLGLLNFIGNVYDSQVKRLEEGGVVMRYLKQIMTEG